MKYLFIILTIAMLTACQTANELQNASSKGLANSYSCGQINSAFSAYEVDKDSFVALKNVAVTSGIVIPQAAASEASSYYEYVKAAANVALLVQGCPPRE